MKFAVFVSGYGSNLQAIIDAVKKKKITAQLVLVVSNNPAAQAISRAQKAGIKTFVLDHKNFSDREQYDRELLKTMKKERIDFVVLAGYMRLLSRLFIRQYRHKILNVHPSLLPAFKGIQGIADAYAYGVKVAGVTIHFVDEELDHGPIIAQKSLALLPSDTLKDFTRKIHQLEHKLYPAVIQLFVEKKIKIAGRRVIERPLGK